MQLRPLGRSPLAVAPLAFGGNVFGWSADEAHSFALLDAFVDAGFNLIDTADVYSAWVPGHRGGESETLIGKWLKQSGRRDKVLIATKVAKLAGRRGLAPENIRRAAEESLQRLQTDRIDLYQAHEDDERVPLTETLGAFAKLIDEGKVRAIGASNYSAGRLAEALAASREAGLPRYESLQPEFNLYDRENYEGELEALARREQVGVIPYYSLASGFLTGKYRSDADLGKSGARGGTVRKYLDAKGERILAALDDVASTHRATPAQVSLAWLMARPGITAPIASATRVEQFAELAAAAELKLSDAEVARLDLAGA